MAKEKTLESQVSGYISTVLREHFGKGFTEQLQLTKRPADLETILQRKITDSFVNWDFANNIAYAVLVLEAKRK